MEEQFARMLSRHGKRPSVPPPAFAAGQGDSFLSKCAKFALVVVLAAATAAAAYYLMRKYLLKPEQEEEAAASPVGRPRLTSSEREECSRKFKALQQKYNSPARKPQKQEEEQAEEESQAPVPPPAPEEPTQFVQQEEPETTRDPQFTPLEELE